MAFSVGWPLAEGLEDLPLVFISRHGETPRTLDILSDLASEQPLSPTQFSLSVHNAVIGLWSILRNETSEMTAPRRRRRWPRTRPARSRRVAQRRRTRRVAGDHRRTTAPSLCQLDHGCPFPTPSACCSRRATVATGTHHRHCPTHSNPVAPRPEPAAHPADRSGRLPTCLEEPSMELAAQALTHKPRQAYYWRLFATALSFCLFGIGGLCLRLLVFPLLSCLPGDASQHQRRARHTISCLFWFYSLDEGPGHSHVQRRGCRKAAAWPDDRRQPPVADRRGS